MTVPFFSIIVPTHNRAHLIGEAIKSVLNQTFKNWELIIVDDGSTDNTREVVSGFNEDRVKYIYQNNAERSAARNNGINNASGEFICFLDSDDYFLPERLEKLKSFIESKQEKVLFFFTEITFDDGKKKSVSTYSPPIQQSLLDYLAQNVIGIPQICISREILLQHQFNPKFRIGEDFELWLRIADKYPLYFQQDNNTIVAIDHDNRSVNLKKFNSPAEQLVMLKTAFNEKHPGHKISDSIKRSIIGRCYFNSAKHFMFNREFYSAIKSVIFSIFFDRKSPQIKHRIFCLTSLLLGQIPSEYKLS